MIVDKVASVKLEFIKDLKDVSVYKTDNNFVFILNGVAAKVINRTNMRNLQCRYVIF